MANYVRKNILLTGGLEDATASTLLVQGFFISTGSDTATLGQNSSANILGTIGTYGANKFALVMGTSGFPSPASVKIAAGALAFSTGAGGGGVYAYSPTNITNKGTISGTVPILESSLASGDYTINNSGLILSDSLVAIQLDGLGIHTIVNTGTMGGAILGQASSFAGVEHVTNSGLIGDISLGLGDDSFTNFIKTGTHIKSGRMDGGIDLGAGNDVFKGGSFAESARDSAGTDIYKLGGGNDYFFAHPFAGASDNDRVDGGIGIDTYDVSLDGSLVVVVNLDSIAHQEVLTGGIPFGQIAAAGLAFSAEIGTDTIAGFENAAGSDADDVMFGNKSSNLLAGNGGKDHLYGFSGNDTLDGGDENDFLVGGTGNDRLIGGGGIDNLFGEAGKDILEGGDDKDSFNFLFASDSRVGAKFRDVITDFSQLDGDQIGLSSIDASTTTPGHDAFHLVGNGGLDPFTPKGNAHQVGELRYFYSGGSTIIEGDINNDAKADFQIELKGHFALTDADFTF